MRMSDENCSSDCKKLTMAYRDEVLGDIVEERGSFLSTFLR